MRSLQSSVLAKRPLSTAVLYSVVSSFPLFFAGGFAVRLQVDLAISKSQFGFAVSAYFITSAIGSFTIGSLIDKFGARAGFILAGAGGGIASILVAVSNSFWPFAFALAVAGISNTAGQLGGNRVLAGVGAQRQGLGFGVKQAAVPLGSFLAGAVVSIVGSGLDWRAAFLGYSVFAFGTVLFAPDGPGSASALEPRRPVGTDRPTLSALAGAGFLGGAAGNGLAVLTVDAFSASGYSESVGAIALAVGSGLTIVMRTSIGWFAGHREASGFVELGAAMALGALGFGLMAISHDNQVILWVASIMAFLGAWGWPGVMYYTIIRNITTTPGTATGFVVTGVFTGGIAGAPLLASIAQRWAYDAAWVTAALMGVVATVLVFLASRLAAVERRRIVSASGVTAR
ncbi:MAG: MFS transporter [Acidimicrobiia bacterium]|nr:MFS transporter [Acidimicrobiia bacterium]